jgi:hypothetical protein
MMKRRSGSSELEMRSNAVCLYWQIIVLWGHKMATLTQPTKWQAHSVRGFSSKFQFGESAWASK